MPQNKINVDDLLVVVPVYNEGEVIQDIVQSIQEQGFKNICVIDDGSLDNTKEILPTLKVVNIRHKINRGAGAATLTGIYHARRNNYRYVVLMDGDGQHDPKDIRLLITSMIETNADIVIGNRFGKENTIPTKRLRYNKIANLFVRLLSGLKYRDTQSGFRLLNRRAIENIELKNRGFGFCSEMIIYAEQNGLKISETPISVTYTPYSMNKGQNLNEGVRTAKSVLWRVLFE